MAISAFTIDATAPTLAEVAPVPTPGNDTTPNYAFSSNEAGTITYGGDCSSTNTSASVGNNTITFYILSAGTHSNCTVRVTDAAGNTSTALAISAFTIDTSAPTVTSIVRKTPDTSPSNADALTWRITFSEDVNDVGTADFSVGGTTATVTAVSEATAHTIYDVTVSGENLAGLNGTVTLGFASGQNIADTAGNPLVDTNPTGTNTNTYVLDNSAPVITEGSNVTVNMSENGNPNPFSLTLHATDNLSATLTWSIQTQASRGTASVTGTGTSKAISYIPNQSVTGSDSFIVAVSDGNQSATITVNINIAAIDDAPIVANPIADVTVNECNLSPAPLRRG